MSYQGGSRNSSHNRLVRVVDDLISTGVVGKGRVGEGRGAGHLFLVLPLVFVASRCSAKTSTLEKY